MNHMICLWIYLWFNVCIHLLMWALHLLNDNRELPPLESDWKCTLIHQFQIFPLKLECTSTYHSTDHSLDCWVPLNCSIRWTLMDSLDCCYLKQFGKHRRIWSCRNRAAATKRMKRHILRLDLCSKAIRFSGVILHFVIFYILYIGSVSTECTTTSLSFYLLLYVSTNEVRPDDDQTVSERDGQWQLIHIGSDYTESIGGWQCSIDSIGIHRVEAGPRAERETIQVHLK